MYYFEFEWDEGNEFKIRQRVYQRKVGSIIRVISVRDMIRGEK